jgi:hypothetical protein
MVEDLEGCVACGGAAGFELSDMKRVSNDRVGCRFDDKAGEVWRLARKNGGDGGVNVEPGIAKLFDCAQTIGDGFTAWLEDFADAIVVGGDGEADAKVCVFGYGLQQFCVAEDVGGAGLDDEELGRMDVDLLQNARHHLLVHFGGLVGVCERGAVDELIGVEFALEQGGGVGFVGGVLAPVFPVVGLEAGLDAHGGHVAIAAAVGAIACRGEGVGEAGFCEKARDGREDAAGLGVVDREQAHARDLRASRRVRIARY